MQQNRRIYLSLQWSMGKVAYETVRIDVPPSLNDLDDEEIISAYKIANMITPPPAESFVDDPDYELDLEHMSSEDGDKILATTLRDAELPIKVGPSTKQRMLEFLCNREIKIPQSVFGDEHPYATSSADSSKQLTLFEENDDE